MTTVHWICADSWRRFAISTAVAAATYFALPTRLSVPTKAITVWDSFAITAIFLAWVAIAITPQSLLRAHARVQDLSRLFILGFVVAAACVALFAVVFLIRNHEPETRIGVTFPVVLALGTVALSWVLLHTVYSIHYAHVYYGDADKDTTTDQGLKFLDEEEPDYLDFAYFSFVIGMTCQVSDVQVTSKRMRRLALLHGVISFGFNTFVLALLINTVSSLL
jgi:uncharacterized membrane protein